MKRKGFLVFALTVMLALGVSAAGANSLSVGYQGLLGNGNNILGGVSVRGWSDAIGYEGTLFSGHVTIEQAGQPDSEASLWLLNGQFMYAPVIKEYSRLYFGMDLGFGKYDAKDFGYGDGDIFMMGPLFGAEYNFQELPELGFNWEISYEFIYADAPGIDISLRGMNATMGVHYRF